MNQAPIDRKALVSRHNIRPADITRVIPLGNGETCFGCDRTGLQTFGPRNDARIRGIKKI